MFPKQIVEAIAGMESARWKIWTQCMNGTHGKENVSWIYVDIVPVKDGPSGIRIYSCKLCGMSGLDENGMGKPYVRNQDTPEWLFVPLAARERYENECVKRTHSKAREISNERSIRREWCELCGTLIEHIESAESTTTHEFKPALFAETFIIQKS